ncbi:IS110 family transposase [Microvirga aerophila]|uniref:IS110 family transposase n=1 Tax=Microvirga aerophila TaxID=670291 RepID=A0A512C1X3_9HYPH|nr:IS110 family transposase [Microvirga aerophila]
MERTIQRVVFAPTGAYHRALERSLATTGLPLAKINPRHARRFAEALGQLAKTDRLDAALLARFGALLEPPTRPVPTPTLDAMKELLVARQALIKDRTAALNRQKIVRSPLLRRQLAQRLRQIAHQLAAIEAHLLNLCKGDADLAPRLAILMSVPGIAQATALSLLVGMPELGSLDQGQVASLAGVAPVAHDSGTSRSRRMIRGGRANLRQALYMPALVAARFNPDLKAKYQALVAAKKPAEVALTAIMRKLIILANALLRDQRHWTPQPA